jgi:16S rRNA (uracil1498-N3)-methyltransferase
VWLPEVEAVSTYAEVIARPGAAVAALDGTVALSRDHRLVVVGPEGGWDAGEVSLAAEHGVPTVVLGAHVLRAETAALAAGALACALRAGLTAAAKPDSEDEDSTTFRR